MSLEIFWQGVLNGLATGGIYILVALGLTLIFGIMNIVQFAHGEIYMLGAYFTYYFSTLFGFNFWIALVFSMIIVAALGLLLERFFFRSFRNQFEPSIIVAVGLMILLQTVALVTFGAETKSMSSIVPGIFKIFGAVLSWDRLMAIIIGLFLVVALFLMIAKTKIGQAMVAVSQDSYAASLYGVNVNRTSAVALSLGSALAAIAGSLMGVVFSVYPTMGGFALTKGIAVVILGGLGSIPGAVIGGLILGQIDGLVSMVSNSTISTVVGFVLIIILLLFRPRGIMGRE